MDLDHGLYRLPEGKTLITQIDVSIYASRVGMTGLTAVITSLKGKLDCTNIY